MQDQRAELILDMIAESSGIARERLQPEATLDELSINSLKLIEAVFEIESKFDIEISTDGLLMVPDVTVGALMQRVLETIDAKGAVPASPAA
ncbi:MAG TPA: acyl carrier protein [Hyphomicrobium sp.]|nr:acyl carrier protein [Hyphomicrobium sp.]